MPAILPQDFHYMRHAIAIASRAAGITSPNPNVGCVIVKHGKILSAAHTAPGGRPHAEAIALAEAGEEARGSTVYVTLEPCAHHGQTSPCAEALVKAGVGRVVIAALDPFEKVNGQGQKILEDAGIQVVVGVCKDEAERLHEGFFSVQRRGRPFVTLKTATSLDGKIALKNGVSKWITGEESRSYVHLMRSRNDAIITGIATVMADDPLLTCRLPGLEHTSPVRVVLDTNLSLPLQSNLAKTAKEVPCWVFTLAGSINNQPEKVVSLEKMGVNILVVNKGVNGKVCMIDAMERLAKNGINTAMVEAGARINTATLRLGLVDRIAWFKAPIMIGDDGIAAFADMQLEKLDNIDKFKLSSYKTCGDDILNIFDLSQKNVTDNML